MMTVLPPAELRESMQNFDFTPVICTMTSDIGFTAYVVGCVQCHHDTDDMADTVVGGMANGVKIVH
jgi:hypothetical protein